MKDNDKKFYCLVRHSLMSLLNRYKNQLDNETFTSVCHFIEYDEYEMAYEGLFIDLMSIKFDPTDIDIPFYLDMGVKLNLDKDSIFDADFWSKFTSYLK